MARRRYHVYRKTPADDDFTRLTGEAILGGEYADRTAPLEQLSQYAVTAVNTRGLEGPRTSLCSAKPMPVPKDAVLDVDFRDKPDSLALIGGADVVDGCLDLRKGGHGELDHRTTFSPLRGLTIQCLVRFDDITQMPVVVSHGAWRQSGWFLQCLGGRWRWHVAGVDCDGGSVEPGRWIAIAAVFDGERAKLYEDGKLVASCKASTHVPWHGKLLIGQYSGGLGDPYQIKGRIRKLRVYQRGLTEKENGLGAW